MKSRGLHVVGEIARRAIWLLVPLGSLSGCAASAPASATSATDERHPEKKQPEPARSASDGEVIGAQGQSPDDTLQVSPTNEHPAAGWAIEEGKLVPDREGRHAQPGQATPAAAPDSNAKPEACPAGYVLAPVDPASTAPAAGVRRCVPAERR